MNEIIDCPTCQGKLRVPDDRGTLVVTCPRCRHRWEWSAGGPISKWLKRLILFGTPEAGFPFGPFDSPGGGWALLLLLGTLSFACSVAVCLMPGSLLTVGNQRVMPYCQAAAVAAWGMLLLSGFVRYLRCRAVAFGSRHTWPVSRSLCMGAVAICLGGISAYPFNLIDGFVLDEHLFAIAVRKAETEDSPEALRDYLANSNREAHRDEGHRLLNACDDRLDEGVFELAAGRADRQDSPAALRDYLANSIRKVRRDEARKRINAYYDRAIEDLKRRAGEQGKDVNRESFDAILALLERMKDEDRPVVTVGFSGRLDPLPVSDDQKETEQLIYEAHLRQRPALKDIADRQPDKSAILSSGRTFEQVEVSAREKVILGRLSGAVKAVIKQEILSFRTAQPGEKTVIDVAYHIHPSGSLYPYLVVDSFEGEKEVKGLIRGYDIKWAITIRPPGAGAEEFVWSLDSTGLDKLTYDSRPGDPEWAPYAVVLYSAFYDMSGRLIRNFGLKPDPAPNTFTFDAVASQGRRRDQRLFGGLSMEEQLELLKLEIEQRKEEAKIVHEDAKPPKGLPRMPSLGAARRMERIKELRSKQNRSE